MNDTAPASDKVSPWGKRPWRELLEQTDEFVYVVELVTSRGVIMESSGQRTLELARRLAEHPRFRALSLTDNPGGNALLSADTLGTDLVARGQEVIIHLSCKDWNRNGLQSHGWELASGGFNNVLCLSGDYPASGHFGRAAAVFDIDSVCLLEMFSQMNAGLPGGRRGDDAANPLTPTNFFLAAVVSNYKRHENELMPQYFKLARKIDCGARYIINQLGYDSRKQDELLKYMAMQGLNVPVLSNVYVLNARAAEFFHDGLIPGCVVTDQLLALCRKQSSSPDKGKAFFLELAAKQIAIAKGLGFRGVYLAGHLEFDDYQRILDAADSFAADDWKLFARQIRFSQPDEFFYFEQDPDTCLASSQVNRAYQSSRADAAMRKARRRVALSYRMNRLVHDKVFAPGSAGFGIGKRLYTMLENTPLLQHLARIGEHTVKMVMFDCRDCGDCSLSEIAYLCPQSQCYKNQRNGPCGGTHDGQCELGEIRCIWSRVYDRLKPYGEEEAAFQGPVIYKDGSLKGTSAWANTFLERDHFARQAAQTHQTRATGADYPSSTIS